MNPSIALDEKCRYVGHDAEVVSLAYSPDGRLLVSGSCDGNSRIWDAETARCLAVLEHHQHFYTIECVMFSPDGNWVLTSTADGPSSDDELGRIRIWKVGVWELAQSFAKPRGYLAFSADSTHVLFGGFDAPVSAGNIHDGSVRDVLRSDGDDGAFCEVYFSRDGRYAVELNREGRMKLWDIQRSAVIRARSWTRQSIVHVWSENGLVGVTTDEPAGVVLLSFDTLSPLCELPCTPVSYQALDLSRRCGTLATCDTLSPLRFWDSNNGTPINVAREPHRYGRTEAFQFSPVAQRLATSWYDLDAGRHVVVELAYTLDPTQRMA